MSETVIIDPQEIGVVEQTKYAPYEKLPDSSKERFVLGLTLKTEDANGEAVDTVVVREHTLIPTLEDKLDHFILNRLDVVQEKAHEENNLLKINLFSDFREHLDQARTFFKSGESAASLLRTATTAHEETHITQKIRYPDRSDLGQFEEHRNSEYLPRRELRRLLLAGDSAIETQAYAAILSNAESLDTKAAREALVYALVLDKAVFAFHPLFDTYMKDAMHGKSVDIASNIFGSLALITKEPRLLEKIWSGDLDKEKIQEQVLMALNTAAGDIDAFIGQRTDKYFKLHIDSAVKDYMDNAFLEVDRLREAGELKL